MRGCEQKPSYATSAIYKPKAYSVIVRCFLRMIQTKTLKPTTSAAHNGVWMRIFAVLGSETESDGNAISEVETATERECVFFSSLITLSAPL